MGYLAARLFRKPIDQRARWLMPVFGGPSQATAALTVFVARLTTCDL